MIAAIRKLARFHGGLHLEAHKAESTSMPIQNMPVSAELTLPLQQHIGLAAEPVVAVGDGVLAGQLLAKGQGYVSAPVHAPTSGKIIAIIERPIPHPSGMTAPCIVMESDGQDKWIDNSAEVDLQDPRAIRNHIRGMGIVGLGGAGFPSFIKLNPGQRTEIDYLVLNGAECEPYITCDEMLMRERPEQVISGLQIMQRALHAKQCIVGIEDNKPEALQAMQDSVSASGSDSILVQAVPTIYPAGGERQLIKVLTGREVNSQGIPLDIGVVCHNVGTAYAVHDAIHENRPLVSRIITVTGDAVHKPQNIEVRLGTPIEEVIRHAGGYRENARHLIIGGPMMGFTLKNDLAPVIKTTNCLLVSSAHISPERPQASPCIRCGACADACPANLLPQQLYWYARAHDFEKIQDYNLFDCIECGCCDYVCPSHIPLVQYYRYAKNEIWAQEKSRKKSDIARKRHEYHNERLEQAKKEKEERLKKRKAMLKEDKGPAKDDGKKQAIEAALARARAKKEQASVKPKNIDNLTEEQQRQIREVEARRKQHAQPKDSSD